MRVLAFVALLLLWPAMALAQPTAPEIAIQKALRQSSPSAAIAVFDVEFPKLDAAGTKSEAVADANLEAARIYDRANLPSKAEARFARGISVLEATAGPASHALIEPLVAYGHHFVEDEPERAAPLFMRAYDLAQTSKGERLAVPGIIVGLANVLAARKDYQAAIQLMQKARAIDVEVLGPEVKILVPYQVMDIELAGLYEDIGAFDQALPLYEEVRTYLEPEYRERPADNAALWTAYQSALGFHWRKRGDFAKAEAASKEAMTLAAKIFPPDSLAFANTECNLGEVYWASGDLDRSLGPIGHCFDLREKATAAVLASGSEEQKRAYIDGDVMAYEKTMTAQIRAKNVNPRLNRLAMTQVLRMKGRVLDAVSGESRLIRQNADDETKALLDELAATRATLAGLSTVGVQVGKIKALEEDTRRLESKLSEKSASFRRVTKEVSIATVRAAIPAGAVLVEIVAFRPLDPHYHTLADQEAEHYVAFVLHGDGDSDPVAIDLGPADAIDRTAAALRTAVSSPKGDPVAPGKALYDQVIAPLEPHLRGKKHLIVSPDGALNTVPFAAMRKNDAYLVGEYQFTYVTSGRDLLRWGDVIGDGKGVVVVANPDFAMNGNKAVATSYFSRIKFSPLPGTESEANAIRKYFTGALTYTGKEATESRIKALHHPRVLHLATHGFFIGAKSGAANTRSLELSDEAKSEVAEAEDPLVRSGLALAGSASLNGGNSEDGILTALESASLDLAGTKLVVLSACQTATGEARNGEGVYGLRRALTTAGAETLVMSLWSVDDEATAYLMQGYYKRLKNGGGRSESLRQVQLELAKSSGVHHPYYWAGFIASGDPSSTELAEKPADTPAPPADKPVEPKADDDEIVDVEPSSMLYAGGTYMNLDNLRNQDDRAAAMAQIALTTPLFSRFIGRGMIGIHDAVAGAVYFGGRTTHAMRYPGGTDESSFAYGARASYELAPGVRYRGFGVYLGAMVEYGTYGIGDARTYGTTLPLLAIVQLPLGGVPIGLRGTYGKWIVDQEVISGSLAVGFGSFDLMFGVMQSKLDASVSLDGDEARASAGRQTSTMGSLSIGGVL